MDRSDLVAWVDEEFVALDLGHAAREQCAREVLSMMAQGSGTRVTDFAETSAQRQQAYGFIENESVAPAVEAMARRGAWGAAQVLEELTGEPHFTVAEHEHQLRAAEDGQPFSAARTSVRLRAPSPQPPPAKRAKREGGPSAASPCP